MIPAFSRMVCMERLPDGTTEVFGPLPQSNLDTYTKLRPADLKRNPIASTMNQYWCEETIGPHQVEGSKLWFGNNFYDSEGQRGVGAFRLFPIRRCGFTSYIRRLRYAP